MSEQKYWAASSGDYWFVVDSPSVDSENRICAVGGGIGAKDLAVKIEAALNAYDANQALISELAGALELSRHSIAAAPDDTWGTASAGDDEWPVAAEILAKIDAALAKARAK